MLTFSLQSGSNGNSIYVEAGDARLIFDAGISGQMAEGRMAARRRRIRECQALILSHNHSDHTRGAGVFSRRFRLPVYVTKRVYQAIRPRAGAFREVHFFEPGDRLQFGGVAVQTIPTPHDGIDTVCFVVEHEGRRLGILTDLGHPFRGLDDVLSGVDGAYLESNYDTDMLRRGSYPEDLKRRIIGDGGHLSNDEAAELTGRHVSRRLQWLAVAHLSENNNRPDLAVETTRRRVGASLPVYLASRYEAGPVLEI